MDLQKSSESDSSQEMPNSFNERVHHNIDCDKQRQNMKSKSLETECSKNNSKLPDPKVFQKMNDEIKSIQSEVEQICNSEYSDKLNFVQEDSNDMQKKVGDFDDPNDSSNTIDKTCTSELVERNGRTEKQHNEGNCSDLINGNSTECVDMIENKSNEFVEDVEPSDGVNLQDTRRRRNSKRKRDEEFCPVCGVTVRQEDLESHFAKEVENLTKIPTRTLRKCRIDEHKEGISTTYVQVKSNRENRLSAKVEMYSSRDRNAVRCPVCNIRMLGTEDEINRHVFNCTNEDESTDEEVVVDGDGFEEYEFADQTRVRTISLVPGGYRSLEGSTSKPKTNEDEDLDVDVDDTMSFGKPQYTEMDIIHSTASVSEVKEIEKLRKAVLLDPNIQPKNIERKWSKETEAENSSQSHQNDGPDQMLSTLKDKIKDLQDQNENVKCLICLDSYTKPVVSTTCWHVHCEECWLMTMGVKKLCPQCNMIVFPSDLRRIYL